MASISNEPGGRRTIQFVGADGKRRSIRLGKVSQRQAEAVKLKVEGLVASSITGHPLDGETARWVAGLDERLAEKLARVGLVPKREAAEPVTLGQFLDEYISGRADVKPASKVIWGHVRRNLVDFFGADKPVTEITPGDADRFKQFLVTEELAPTTIHKRLQHAKTFFRAMFRRKLISENPFADVKAAATASADRQRFITREETDLLLQACPDHHWRTIVALARYGGLRCPSEVLSLRWQDVDWERSRVVVRSPKTEHHAGKDARTIPLYPELRPVLEEAWDAAPEGAVYVVDERFRKSALTSKGWLNCNLRTTFEKIIRRAGLSPWPRQFHNLRASRETELIEQFPIQTVTAWMGNTPNVAMRHYLMTTEEHFARALQNPVQSAHARRCTDVQPALPAHEKTPVLPGFAASCTALHSCKLEGTGFEPV